MKFIKKNQVVVAVIGIMLIAAGYLNFTNEERTNSLLEKEILKDSQEMAAIGDAKLVSSEPVSDSNLVEEEKVEEKMVNTVAENIQEEQTIEETNNEVVSDEYFTKSRLERDTMYSQMIESYQKILDKTTISESQKNTAQKEITKINKQKNAIMITENLIKTKGFDDLVIFVNDGSINVIIKANKLDEKQIAQVQNIITRELEADISDIHISNKE